MARQKTQMFAIVSCVGTGKPGKHSFLPASTPTHRQVRRQTNHSHRHVPSYTGTLDRHTRMLWTRLETSYASSVLPVLSCLLVTTVVLLQHPWCALGQLSCTRYHSPLPFELYLGSIITSYTLAHRVPSRRAGIIGGYVLAQG